ncbi:MAG: hypothetical protein AB7P03_23510 [Kofleriaceae bacterium]
MTDLPLWKRMPVILGLVALSLWLASKAVQTIEVACEPDADGHVSCRYELRYAGITRRAETFTPASDRVTWRRVGKHQNQGEVYAQLATGDKLTIEWLSDDEAEAAAAQLVRDPHFKLESTGPRWWVMFLLVTIPVAVVLVRPQRPAVVKGDGVAPPVVQSKKARRAARGRQRKAADRRS